MPDEHVVTARAVYDASADTYIQFVGTELTPATEGPVDRALLGAFVELVEADGGGLVADVGCGPGRVAAFLAAQGVPVVGLDVSPAMVAAARAAHPDIRFDEGRLDDLPLDAGSLAGAVCWYSIIYTPPERLDEAFTALAYAIHSGGHLLVAFQSGAGEAVHRPDAHRTGLALTSYRHDIAHVTHQLSVAGLGVVTTTSREPALPHEVTPQAFVIAQRR